MNLSASFSAWAELVGRYLLDVTNTVTEFDPGIVHVEKLSPNYNLNPNPSLNLNPNPNPNLEVFRELDRDNSGHWNPPTTLTLTLT